jgi:hypothetical protein
MTDDAKQERKAVLLPCPFCGAEAVHFENAYGTGYIIHCPEEEDCMVGPYVEMGTEEQSIAAWNTRQPQTDALKIALWHLERIRDVEDIDPVWAAMSALAAIDAALKESK